MRRRQLRRRVPGGSRWDLHYGPFGITPSGESDWSTKRGRPPAFSTDTQAKRAFEALELDVGPDDWAYWRFVENLEPEQALAALWAFRKRKWAAISRAQAADAEAKSPGWWYAQRSRDEAARLEREADQLERVLT